MKVLDWLRLKVLDLLGLGKYGGPGELERLTFISDSDRLLKTRIRECNIWYDGDGEELLNFYTRENTIGYHYEPFYSRNKKNYFWAISSTENDIKRSHSGQPRNIVDTLVSIIKFPLINAGGLNSEDNAVNQHLQAIMKDSKLKELYRQEQLPLTLVEGWGCYKINWDEDLSEYPIPVYYRAENVDFIYKMGRIIAIVFKDYYVDKNNRKYMLAETRRFGKNAAGKRTLVIENELFRAGEDGEYVNKVELTELPETAGIQGYIEIGSDDRDMNLLLAVPCILFRNTSNIGGYGRSIFTGKIDLFDDLDQCLSQASNSVRKSTPVEYMNSDYLERDVNGLAKQPHAYDRKYVVVNGARGMDGESKGEAVQVTQPQINFQQYSDQAIAIMMQIINGIMSPATLGIDISKKDNAEAQREKEKVTIFTRNLIIDAETDILKDLCSQLLCAYEMMRTGAITVDEYEISLKFSEFADDSYENKLEKLGAAYDSENISDEMFMQKLYGDTLSRADYDRELKWLKEHHSQHREDAYQGASGGGANLPGMAQNMTNAYEDEEEI